MSVILEFSMFPVGKGESLSGYVARCLEIVRASGVAYDFGPMGTALEGEWNEVMGVVEQCYEDLKEDCDRISCHISIDYREDREDGLKSKVESVEKKLMRKLK